MTYAFPHNTVVVDKEGGIIEHHRGMELRDYFAAKAMQSILLDPRNESNSYNIDANCAYMVADAMMAAREK
jgi:hypothetical protein